jgi:hypothetical protein
MGEEDWVGKAHLFAQEKILPIADAMEREESIPPPLLKAMGEAGFFGLTIPKEFGGQAASASAIAGVISEISEASLSVATLLAVHLSVASAPISQWGTSSQKKEYLPRMARGEWVGAFALTEPGAGSDAQHLTTRYGQEREVFRIDGAKTFITNGGQADVVLVFATRDPQLESKGISCFLVRKGTRGFSVSRRLDKLGLRGSETTEILFDGCLVGREAFLGKEGEGFRIAMTALEGGRVGIAASSWGVAKAALALMRQGVGPEGEDWKKTEIARAYVEVEAAGALVSHAAALKDAGQEYGLAASAAKVYASQAAFKIASRAMDVAGLRSPESASRLERIFRDSRVLSIVEGTTEIQELILGRVLVSRGYPPHTH